jgi:hypothetical protein
MFKHTDGTSKREQQEDQGNKEAADFTQHLPECETRGILSEHFRTNSWGPTLMIRTLGILYRISGFNGALLSK